MAYRIMQVPTNEGSWYDLGDGEGFYVRREWLRDETYEVREFGTAEQANAEAMALEDQNARDHFRAFEVVEA